MPITLSCLPGLDGFVRPRFDDGSFDDPLPLGEHFVERFLAEDAPRVQLVIQGPRGSGLTTTLRWLAHLTREVGSRRVLTWDDVLGDCAEEVLLLLAHGEGILFLDMSITPLAPEAWRAIESAMLNGLRDRSDTWQADREILRSARMVLVCPSFSDDRPFGKATRWAEGLSNRERVFLAPWSDDDLLELLGSSERYREGRARLFDSLRGIRHGHKVLGRPRTARWLVDAALPEQGEQLTLSSLYANVLDGLSPWAIELLRELREDALTPTLVKRVIDAPPEDPEEAANLFELSRVLAALLHELPGYVGKKRATVQERAKGTSLLLERPPLALPGLHDFLQAGACLQEVGRGDPPTLPRKGWHPFLREMITPWIRERLRDLLRGSEPATDAASASILWATGEVPVLDASRRTLSLHRAWLAGISLPGVDLSQSNLWEANLTGARLEGANLSHTMLQGLRAPGAVFDGALLETTLGGNQQLARASFRGAQMSQAGLRGADLTGACFEGAVLVQAKLSKARLDRAELVRADLTGADLNDASLSETRFSGSDLSEASLWAVDLRSAWLDGVILSGTDIRESWLCGVELDAAPGRGLQFSGCDLSEATFRSADLQHAIFTKCRMHDVVFDGADLRGATFSGVDFHAGSSRSGLLLGKPAQEGNMTGYYSEGTTDEKWASPESIRQASFRGADLRCVLFENTDLNRVDMRGARMDISLREIASKAGAILD